LDEKEMKNTEFKTKQFKDATVYTLESATGMGSGSIASVSSPIGGVRRRGDNLIAQEANTDKIDASKPRNFVAKNAKTGGAGAHKDKKKAEKQGDVKHKNKDMDMAEGKDDKIAQLKKDHDTAVHWSKNEKSPQKREAARQKAEKIKAHLEKQYKQGVAEGSDGWIGNPAKWKEAVLQAHGPDVVFKNYSHPGQPGKRSVNAMNAQGKQVGVYQRHNKMGMVQPSQQGVAEGSLNEDKGFDVVKSLVSAFNNSVSGNVNIPLAAERPGSRVFTRSDGTRYRDHGNIRFYQGWIDPQDVDKWKATKPVEKFWDWLKSQPGVKPIGQVSGEFRQDPMRDAVAYKGQYFVLTPHGSVIWGSVSRFKNPRSVWRQQNPKQGMAEGSGANKTHLAMAYLKAVVMAPTGTPEKRRILNWQQILSNQFDIEMDPATLAQMLPQLDSQLQSGNLDKLQNRMASRGELEIGESEQGVSEGDRPFRGVGGAFNRGDDERHDLDPTEWYIVKDGKMFKTSVYPNQVQLAIAQGYSRTRDEAKAKAGEQGVAEAVDIGKEWMSDTELDQYVPDRLQQQWRELLGYDMNGNPSAYWANLTGGYEPDVNDPQHRALMVKVANKWFTAKKIPNVKFFDVKDADDELEWLVQIGEQGVAEGPAFDKWADERAASQLHKLKPGMVRDRKTGKWYDPNKEFDKKMNSPEVMAQMKRMAQKEGVAEGSKEKKLDAIRDKHDNYNEEWSQKYKSSINCSHPKGFSQKAHCAGKNKHNESMMTMEATCPDCGMCQTHGNLNEIKKGAKDSNGYTSCWSGYHAAGTKKSATTGKQVRNCVPNESVSEDHEIQMASSELQSIAKNAESLLDMVRRYSEQDGLQAWQQSKITKAADYLNSVLQSVSGEQTDRTSEDHSDMGQGFGKNGYRTAQAQKIHPDAGNVPVSEDEYMAELFNKLAEKIPANAPVDVWIKDFQKANPNKYHQFKNKTPEKKAQMAVAASYGAKNPSKKK
jgi:hypothetical protein